MPGALSKRRTFGEYTAPAAVGWPAGPARALAELPANRAVTKAGEILRRHSVSVGAKASSRAELRAHARRALDDWQAHLARRDQPRVVYQLHDTRGRLLYVGSTDHLAERLRQHAKRQTWWDQVTHRTIEAFPNREAAVVRERDIIVRNAPLHNRTQPRPEPTIVIAARTYLESTS